jgi:hypothetical protein
MGLKMQYVNSLDGKEPELMALAEVLGWLVDIMIVSCHARQSLDDTSAIMFHG